MASGCSGFLAVFWVNYILDRLETCEGRLMCLNSCLVWSKASAHPPIPLSYTNRTDFTLTLGVSDSLAALCLFVGVFTTIEGEPSGLSLRCWYSRNLPHCFNEYTHTHSCTDTCDCLAIRLQEQEKNYLKVNFRFPAVELSLGVAAKQRRKQCTHVHTNTHPRLMHLSVSAPVALAHSMDDQKRPTAADHYANDTLSKSPESAATWQPLGIESGTLKEGWRITVSTESKAESEIFIMHCSVENSCSPFLSKLLTQKYPI